MSVVLHNDTPVDRTHHMFNVGAWLTGALTHIHVFCSPAPELSLFSLQVPSDTQVYRMGAA